MSDERQFRVQWGSRTEPLFAMVAEALETQTDLIVGATSIDPGIVLALFTPDLDKGDHTVWTASLRRDEDGILRVRRIEPSAEMTAELAWMWEL